jgi:hypothetical protein
MFLMQVPIYVKLDVPPAWSLLLKEVSHGSRVIRPPSCPSGREDV